MKVWMFVMMMAVSLTAVAQKEVLVVKTDIACDHCNACGSCEKRIADYLFLNVKGIKGVQVDTKAETIAVTYNADKTDPETIKKAITRTGYDADELKADPVAYQKLDGCCKRKE